jgi:hypothetical protein
MKQGFAQAATGPMKFEVGGNEAELDIRAAGYGREAPLQPDEGAGHDPQVLDTLQQQQVQVYEATVRLNQMHQEHQKEEKEETSSIEGASMMKRILKSVERSRSNMSIRTFDEKPARLSFDKVLDLLLDSMEGRFDGNVPRQKCASPVPYNAQTQGYQPLFYVSKEPKMAKTDEGIEGIPVRYQGFTKSTVWFSKRNPCWGLAARRMQHQSRMKQKSILDNQDMASKAALFFHIFEGFSYVLIHRKSPDEEVVKGKMTDYIVEKAAKFVQIWPASQAQQHLEQPPPLHRTANGAYLYRSTSEGLASDGLDADMMALRVKGQAPAKPSFVSKRSISSVYDYEDTNEAEYGGEKEEPENKRRSQNYYTISDGTEVNAFGVDFGALDSIFDATFYDMGANGEGGFVKREDDADYLSASDSETTTLHDFMLDSSDDGFGASHDPTGLLLCDAIFKCFCDSMSPEQFSREYKRIQSLLFNQDFAQTLRIAVDNRDPRLDAEFLFPGSQSKNEVDFIANVPVGRLVLREQNARSMDLVVESSDAVAEQILGVNPQGTEQLFDSLDKDDVNFIMTRYILLDQVSKDRQERNSNIWFHRIVTLDNKRPAVLRAYVNQAATNEANGKMECVVLFQDVSHLYQNLLSLPTYSCL